MKISSIRVFNDLEINIDLFELIFWTFFFFFIEFGFTIFLDPLGFNNEMFGYELDEIFELIILFFLPLLVVYFGDTVSGFHYILAFFIYGILTGPVIPFLVHDIFADVLGVLFLWIFIDDLVESRIDNEGDFADDLDDFSDDYFAK